MATSMFTQPIIAVRDNLNEQQRTRAAALIVARDVLGPDTDVGPLTFLADWIMGLVQDATEGPMEDAVPLPPLPDPRLVGWESNQVPIARAGHVSADWLAPEHETPPRLRT